MGKLTRMISDGTIYQCSCRENKIVSLHPSLENQLALSSTVVTQDSSFDIDSGAKFNEAVHLFKKFYTYNPTLSQNDHKRFTANDNEEIKE